MTDKRGKAVLRNKGLIIIVCALVLGLVLVIAGTLTAGVRGGGTSAAYEEEQIAKLVSTLSGVSDVSVIATFENTGESVYSVSERAYDGAGWSGEPAEVCSICPKLRGIAVTANGAGDPVVQSKIISLLCAAYDIASNRIYVCGR